MSAKGILGRKLGMTQIWDDENRVVPVTVIEAGPCRVVQLKTPERDGYSAVQLAFDEIPERKLTKAELGHLKKAGAGTQRTLIEFRDADLGGEDDPKVGDTVTVSSFQPGQPVKVSGVSIGKGFAGTIKRHNFHRGPVSHGSHNVRAPGSIGASADPARVFRGQRMPGRLGGGRVTQLGLEVVQVDADRNLLLIKGSVPGSRNAIVEVRGAAGDGEGGESSDE
jgi:large subunit ribosomal protein L3